MTDTFARSEICRVGRSLFDRGYVHATAGNISVRLDDGFLITPTDACLGFLVEDELAKVNANGRQVSGSAASKTLELHRRIYAADRAAGGAAGCIIHTHSTHAVALTLEGAGEELLPPITPYFVMKVGRVPVLPYRRPGDPEVANLAADAIAARAKAGTPIRALMPPRLGPTVWHDSTGQAMAVLEELEETAKLWRTSSPRPAALDETQIAELRSAFGARW